MNLLGNMAVAILSVYYSCASETYFHSYLLVYLEVSVLGEFCNCGILLTDRIVSRMFVTLHHSNKFFMSSIPSR